MRPENPSPETIAPQPEVPTLPTEGEVIQFPQPENPAPAEETRENLPFDEAFKAAQEDVEKEEGDKTLDPFENPDPLNPPVEVESKPVSYLEQQGNQVLQARQEDLNQKAA